MSIFGRLVRRLRCKPPHLPMTPTVDSEIRAILDKLETLRVELVELAFTLDRRGRTDAADVAMQIRGRVGELCEEFVAGGEGRESRG